MIPMFILSLLGRIGGMIRSLGPSTLIIIAIGLFGVVQTWRLHDARHDELRALAKVVQMTGMLKETDRRIRVASAQAMSAAIKNKRIVEARYTAAKRKADDDYTTLAANFSIHSADYARRMRVGAQAAQGGSGDTDLPVASCVAEIADGPDQTAFVAVSQPDFERMNQIAARLVNAQAWAKGLGE
jgi:hypothetical protein